jgi:hypothetical protein
MDSRKKAQGAQKYRYFAPYALLRGQFFSRFVIQVADSSVNELENATDRDGNWRKLSKPL